MSLSTRIFFAKLFYFFMGFFDESNQDTAAASTSEPPSAASPSSEFAQHAERPTQISVPTKSDQLFVTTPLSVPFPQTPAPGLPLTTSLQNLSRAPLPNPRAVSNQINSDHDPRQLHSESRTPPPSIRILPPSTSPPLVESEPYHVESMGPQSTPSLHQSPPLHTLTPHASPSSLIASNIREHGMFNQAHDMVFHNPQFAVNNNPHFHNISPTVGSGLEKLLNHSMPDAFHDSAARDPPPRCHLGTRKDYVARVTDWALGNVDPEKPVLWLHGPFGIGKTAVAQTSAEGLRAKGKLLATLFFSRSNANRNNPLQVFTSFAYHIATQCATFATIIDARIRKDPAITTKSLAVQFEELLVIPLSQIDVTRENLDGRVVIIDGLDECRGVSEQRKIIEIIGASARDRTTPFRWFITSRPEIHITQTMRFPSVSPIVSSIELSVSREIDHEILLYLTDEFKKISEQNDLEGVWPSEDALARIVERADGLWIYASTITRFVSDNNSFSPEHQLRLVLKFTLNRVLSEDGTFNPLADMDVLYTLIMEQVPLTIRTALRKILLLHSVANYPPRAIADALGLSTEQFHRCCASIQSVMQLTSSESILGSVRLYFYHASFLEFLTSPERSRGFSIHGAFLIGFRKQLLDWLHFVYSRTEDCSEFVFPSEMVLPENITASNHYSNFLDNFWELCCMEGHPIDAPTAESISQLPFQKLFSLLPIVTRWSFSHDGLRIMIKNLPPEFQDNVVRIVKCPTPGCTNNSDVVILGKGENEVITPSEYDRLWLKNNHEPLVVKNSRPERLLIKLAAMSDSDQNMTVTKRHLDFHQPPSHNTYPQQPCPNRSEYNTGALDIFWELCCVEGHPIDVSTGKSTISQMPFRKSFSLLPREQSSTISHKHLQIMIKNLPAAFKNKIVRFVRCPTRGCTNAGTVVILGEGENEVIAPCDGSWLEWRNNQNLKPGECPCGGQIFNIDSDSDSDWQPSLATGSDVVGIAY
ncbi:hypothetical protein NP233_g2183 [Leucocoprinus birnbaumii]|uniref:Nephrocystin 3-like N-terminal domain-containing protein n=1 Tax=Leucocoprinus birnbaumii TaxID=56174 RepID=A0AAD5W184_9AGAR|nr:hypothetical protein NP233_g2183 [Leucocoprinus birnbaumii]